MADGMGFMQELWQGVHCLRGQDMKTYDYDAYKKKYTSKHRSYCFNLDSDKDKKLIEWLDRQENKSGEIRKILREVIIG